MFSIKSNLSVLRVSVACKNPAALEKTFFTSTVITIKDVTLTRVYKPLSYFPESSLYQNIVHHNRAKFHQKQSNPLCALLPLKNARPTL